MILWFCYTVKVGRRVRRGGSDPRLDLYQPVVPDIGGDPLCRGVDAVGVPQPSRANGHLCPEGQQAAYLRRSIQTHQGGSARR